METVCRIPLLSLCLLMAAGSLGSAYKGPRLTRCPSRDLTLEVPEDLPEGALLFDWDPDLVVVSSSREAYRRLVGKALNADASPNTRAFFTGAPVVDDAFSLAPGGHPWASLSRPLPPATHLLRGGDLLTCAPARKPSGPAVLGPAAHTVTKFRVHLRLLRVPLRLVAEPRSPEVLPGSLAGTVVAYISVFAHGKQVAEPAAACAVTAGPAALTVHVNGSLMLASAMPDKAADHAGRGWLTTVTCEWRGLRARLRLRVAPLRLWRRPRTHIQVAVATAASSSSSSPDVDNIRAGVSLRLSLAPLMTTAAARRHPPPRVRLLAASHPARIRLLPFPAPGALLLDLPPLAEPLEVTLEARDSAGRTEVANLTLTASDSASIMHGPAASAAAFGGWWWPVPLLACAAALALAMPAFCALLLWRRLRHGYTGVKPEFI